MSTIDWLILAPAIPAIPVFVTWYLPWERWIPWRKLPKAVVGPYALYLFFAAFHFDDNYRYWWLYYGWLAIAGVVVSVKAVVEKVEGRVEKEARERKASMLEQAQRWPVAEGLVLHTGQGSSLRCHFRISN